MRSCVLIASLLVSCAAASQELEPYPKGFLLTGVVTTVSDGDTAQVTDENGSVVKIRFWGVDTPESRVSNRWPDQAYSKDATSFTRSLIEGKTVMVRMTGETTYSRHVGEIIVNGKSVSRELVRNGLAHWYKSYATYDSDLRRLEETARQEKRGLWGDINSVAPQVWRNELDHDCPNNPDC